MGNEDSREYGQGWRNWGLQCDRFGKRDDLGLEWKTITEIMRVQSKKIGDPTLIMI